MKTRSIELFGIQHPIILGSIHYVGFAGLAAVGRNAGGLGIITGLTQKTPALLANEIAKCRALTDKSRDFQRAKGSAYFPTVPGQGD